MKAYRQSDESWSVDSDTYERNMLRALASGPSRLSFTHSSFAHANPPLVNVTYIALLDGLVRDGYVLSLDPATPFSDRTFKLTTLGEDVVRVLQARGWRY